MQCGSAAAAKSALAFDNKSLNGNNVQIRRTRKTLGSGEQGALRCRNWPWRASEEEFYEFFAGYNPVEGSLKFQVNEEGKKMGNAAILFASSEDAERCFKEKQGQELGGRKCFLDDLDVEDHADFENFNPDNKNVRCSDSVNEDNVDRAVKLRGLPWAANKGTVLEFFEGFKLKKSDVTIDI